MRRYRLRGNLGAKAGWNVGLAAGVGILHSSVRVTDRRSGAKGRERGGAKGRDLHGVEIAGAMTVGASKGKGGVRGKAMARAWGTAMAAASAVAVVGMGTEALRGEKGSPQLFKCSALPTSKLASSQVFIVYISSHLSPVPSLIFFWSSNPHDGGAQVHSTARRRGGGDLPSSASFFSTHGHRP